MSGGGGEGNKGRKKVWGRGFKTEGKKEGKKKTPCKTPHAQRVGRVCPLFEEGTPAPLTTLKTQGEANGRVGGNWRKRRKKKRTPAWTYAKKSGLVCGGHPLPWGDQGKGRTGQNCGVSEETKKKKKK